MAKKSAKARNEQRYHVVEKLNSVRADLRKIIKNSDGDEQLDAVNKLQKLPRNSSYIRLRRRCNFCGRPHATSKKFGLCRIHLREAVMRGDVPGLRKASW